MISMLKKELGMGAKGKAKAKPKQPPAPVVSRRRRRQRRRSGRALKPLADVSLWSQHHHPPFVTQPISHMSSTFVQERLSFTLPNGTVNYVGCLIGGFDGSLGSLVSSNLAISGASTTVPSTGSSVVSSVQMANYLSPSGKVKARINRLKAVITNTGSGNSYPSGLVWAGTLDAPVKTSDFATWTDLNNWLIGRRQLHDFTAFSLMDRREGFVSYPLDHIAYESYNDLEAGTRNLTDTLAPIAIVLAPNAVVSNYLITLYVEWNLLFCDDPVLQSTHTHHRSVSSNDVTKAAKHASNSNGYLGRMEHAVGQAVERAAAGALRSRFPRAARALAPR